MTNCRVGLAESAAKSAIFVLRRNSWRHQLHTTLCSVQRDQKAQKVYGIATFWGDEMPNMPATNEGIVSGTSGSNMPLYRVEIVTRGIDSISGNLLQPKDIVFREPGRTTAVFLIT